MFQLAFSYLSKEVEKFNAGSSRIDICKHYQCFKEEADRAEGYVDNCVRLFTVPFAISHAVHLKTPFFKFV